MPIWSHPFCCTSVLNVHLLPKFRLITFNLDMPCGHMPPPATPPHTPCQPVPSLECSLPPSPLGITLCALRLPRSYKSLSAAAGWDGARHREKELNKVNGAVFPYLSCELKNQSPPITPLLTLSLHRRELLSFCMCVKERGIQYI